MNRAKSYCKRVLKTPEIYPETVVLACERFKRFTKQYDYRKEEGDRWVNFIEKNLCHWQDKWAGQPIILEDWQVFILHSIFAFYDKGGFRLVSSAYIQLPRKNAKTTLVACIALGHIFIDKVHAPQVLIGANNEDQAKICSTCAGNILEASPVTKSWIADGDIKLYKYRDKIQSIVYPENKGEIMPMSRDTKTKDGFNPSLGIIDEYHEATSSALLEVIETGQGARENPMTITITTAGFNKYGPCYQNLRRVSIDVLRGIKQDDHLFTLIYEPDETDKTEDDDINWQDPNLWKKVNPGYGSIVYPSYFEKRFIKAKNEGGEKEVNFKTKNLNIWTDSSNVWIQDHIWMLGNKPVQTKGKKGYGGLDMAYKRDFTAYVWISLPDEDGVHDVVPYFWVPKDTIRSRLKEESASILQWIDQGYIFATEGNVTDHAQVSKFIFESQRELETIKVSADPAHAVFVIGDLNEHGLECIELPQTAARLTPAITFMYELALKGKLRHGGNPVLRWMISNAIIKKFTNDLVLITKEFENQKIDGVDGCINALHPFTINEEAPSDPVIELW